MRYRWYQRLRFRAGVRLLAPHLQRQLNLYNNLLLTAETDSRRNVIIGARFGIIVAGTGKPYDKLPGGTLPRIQ